MMIKEMPAENDVFQNTQDQNVKSSPLSLHSGSLSNQRKSVPLTELLEKIPLAYSPITKQLHLICPHPVNNTSTSKPCNESRRPCDIIDHDKSTFVENNEKFEEENNVNCLEDVEHCKDDGMSEIPMEEGGLPETEGSSLSSEASHQPDESLVEDSAKAKKRSISSFFTKSVFSWKSRDVQSTPASSTFSSSVPGWKIFSRSVPDSSSTDSLGDSEVNSSNCSSLHPLDSPVSLRSVASGSKRYEDVVASSSALILHDRPANLPAKSSDEEAKHRQEYEQMVEAAKKKERQEAKLRKKQLQQQIKTEERLASATKVWTNEILPKWNNNKNCRKIRNLWWQGIPPCVRGRVWQLAIANELNITPQLYDICVTRAQELLRAVHSSSSSCEFVEYQDNPDRQASVELIQLDISRTFPQLCIFQKGGPYYNILHSLLGAYACYRPDIGYVQGMSFLAAILILNMEEADAFICFANLLNRPCHLGFFRLDQPVMQAYYTVFEQLMSENLPKIFSHFTTSNLSPDLYLLDWIYTVFAKAMPLDVACRVWDVFLRDGEEFLFRTALGVLHNYQELLLTFDFLTGAQFLTKLPEDLNADNLFQSIQLMRMQRYSELLCAAHTSCGLGSVSSTCSTANNSGTNTPAELN